MKVYPPIIIIGMSRSGTSMLTRMLDHLGLFVGNKLTGNHEAIFFREINDWLLTQCSGGLEDPGTIKYLLRDKEARDLFGEFIRFTMKTPHVISHLGFGKYLSLRTPESLDIPWGWKDPRNSVTLPIWLRLFPGARVIHVLRNGIDVSISLHRREVKVGSRNPDVAENLNCFADYLRLWEDYVGGCLEHVSSFPNGDYRQVRYENLLVDPGRELGEILEFLKITPSTSKFERVKKSIKTSRLDNQKFRDEFSAQIATLPESSMMRELGYR